MWISGSRPQWVAPGYFPLWRLKIGRSEAISDFSIRGNESIPLNRSCPNQSNSLPFGPSFRYPYGTATAGSSLQDTGEPLHYCRNNNPDTLDGSLCLWCFFPPFGFLLCISVAMPLKFCYAFQVFSGFPIRSLSCSIKYRSCILIPAWVNAVIPV